MGSIFSVAEKGVAPMEPLNEKDDDEQLIEGNAHNCLDYRETVTIALSESSPESSTHSHALPLLPEWLPTHITSLQEQQSYSQLVEEKETYKRLYEEAEVTCRRHIKKKDDELLHLQHQLHKLQRLCREENAKVKVYQEKCKDLLLKIERAEYHHSQQSIADSGSYQDSAATPPLLQIAADSIKDAITACASELFSRIKKNFLPINLARMNLDSRETGRIIKFALQSFLCHILFIGFEDPFFFALNDCLPPFEKPAKRKTHFLQVYKRCRDLEGKQMFDEEADFAHFFDVKEFELCTRLKDQVLMTDDVQKKEEFIALELCSRNNNYYSKLLRLVKAVWVLHKLAFAFEPRAEIFRVGQGSVLDEEFMEDVAGDDDNADDHHEDEEIAESSRKVKQVRFMCVPGFTVRHTIIRSRVFSFKECICGLSKDPSPMTVD